MRDFIEMKILKASDRKKHFVFYEIGGRLLSMLAQ